MAAFAGHPHSRQTEHLIVNGLRSDHALTISLVAESEGEVVGHIAFSPIQINGRESLWLILGPIGVLPKQQRCGIGQALVRAGLEAMKALGAEGCVLVGEPAYYSRFGFRQVDGLLFEGVPREFCMCLGMGGPVPCGTVSYHAAFSITS